MFWSNPKFKGNIFVNVVVLKIRAILFAYTFLKHLCFKIVMLVFETRYSCSADEKHVRVE